MFGQLNGDYRSAVNGGSWNSAASWEIFTGTVPTGTWGPAVVPPTSASGAITIRNTFNIIHNSGAAITIDATTVQPGATLTIAPGFQITVANGPSTDLNVGGTVDVQGTLQLTAATLNIGGGAALLNVTGNLFNNGFIAGATVARTRFQNGSVYEHQINDGTSVVPTATWSDGSVCRIVANLTAVPQGFSQSFYNLEWNTPTASQTLTMATSTNLVITARNNFSIINTGGRRLFFSRVQTVTINVGKDFIIGTAGKVAFNVDDNTIVNVGDNFIVSSNGSGGLTTGGSFGTGAVTINAEHVAFTTGSIFDASGTYPTDFLVGSGITTFNIRGNYSSAGTFRRTGTAPSLEMHFTGSAIHSFTSTAVPTFPINFYVEDDGNLDIAATSRLAGSGNLTVDPSARLTVRSTQNQGAYRTTVALGNVQLTGTRTILGSLAYGGTALQRISPESPGDVHTIIDNPAHVRMVGNQTFTTGTLNLMTGYIQVRNFTLTVSNVAHNGGRIQVINTSNLIINGTGVYGNVANNNPTGQLLLNGTQIGSLTVNRTSGGLVTKTGNLTIATLLDLQNGNLALGATTTTVNGNFAATSGTMTAAGGALTFQNAGTMPTGADISGTLATLTMNRTGDLNLTNTANLDVTRLNVYNGNISNTGALRMANGGTIYRTNGHLTAAIGAVNLYNVQYTNFSDPSITTEFEIPEPPVLPATTTALNALTINNAAGATRIVALDKDIVAAGQIRMQSGTLHANNKNISTRGNLRIDAAGGLVPGKGTYTFNGSTAQTFTSTPAEYSFVRMVVNKTGGGFTLASPLTIRGSFEVNSITTVNAGTNRLTLRSTADTTAYIPTMPGTASNNRGRINGSVIVQRYLPNGNLSRQYRYLSAPTTTTMVSDWQNEIPITGAFSNPSSGTFDGIKIISKNPSMFYYNEPTSAYVAYPVSGSSTVAPVASGRGYAVFGRTHSVTPTTLDSHGTLGQWNVNVTVTNTGGGPSNGYNLVGNPYPAPVDWEAVLPASQNIGSTISLIDNNDNGPSTGTITYSAVFHESVPEGAFDGIISMGQGFWVSANPGGGAKVVRFTESQKVAGQSKFIRKGKPENFLRLAMTQGAVTDHLAVVLYDSATDAYDYKYDGLKFVSSGLRVTTLASTNEQLVINAISKGDCEKTVPIEISEAVAGSYTFNFTGLESFDSDVEPVLVDKLENKTISISSTPTYTFNVSDAAAVKGRFVLRFNGPALNTQLEVKGETICVGNTPAVITLPTTQAGVQYTAMLNESVISSAITGNGGQVQIPLSVDALPQGASEITISAQRASCTSQLLTQKATINVLRKPAISSVTGGQVCGTGTASLTAAAVDGSLFNWYEGLNDATPIDGQHGASFTTLTLTKSKTYYVAAVNAAGCEGERVEVKATVLDLTPAAITIDGGNTLTSNYESGNQWYLDGELMDGVTGKSIEASKSGVYTVVVNTGTCTTTSEGREMLILGTEGDDALVRIYPNPAPDKVHVEVRGKADAAVQLISTTGLQLRSTQLSGNDDLKTATFDITSLPDGMYLVRVNVGAKTYTKKILKAK